MSLTLCTMRSCVLGTAKSLLCRSEHPYPDVQLFKNVPTHSAFADQNSCDWSVSKPEKLPKPFQGDRGEIKPDTIREQILFYLTDMLCPSYRVTLSNAIQLL